MWVIVATMLLFILLLKVLLKRGSFAMRAMGGEPVSSVAVQGSLACMVNQPLSVGGVVVLVNVTIAMALDISLNGAVTEKGKQRILS